MLVLSRRPGQKVLFPGLGITVEVLRSNGAVTRLGIEAPDDVAVMREEIAIAPSTSEPSHKSLSQSCREKLGQLTSRLENLQKQLEGRQVSDPEKAIDTLLAELTDLERLTNDAVVDKDAVFRTAPPRVLIVEDQDNERELLATCLRLGGIDVATASNGREAFDRLHDFELPDLVLLDMRMPDIDGPTLLRAIREDLRLNKLRVFAVSGSSPGEFIENCQPLPLDGWFSKPVRIDALLQAVRNECSPTAVS